MDNDGKLNEKTKTSKKNFKVRLINMS
jgi:hypothetical protein